MSAPFIKTMTLGVLFLAMDHAAMAQTGADEQLGGGSARLANQAYESYDKRDFADADSKAEMVLKLRPGATKLWLLRIYSQQQQGKQDAALAIAEAAVSANRKNTELLQVRDSLRVAKQSTAASQTKNTNEVTARAPSSTNAVNDSPTQATSSPGTPDASLQKQHINGSAAADNTSAAAATRSPAIVQRSAQQLAWRNADAAYKSYARGDYAQARKYARRSLRLRPRQPEMKRLLEYATDRQNASSPQTAALPATQGPYRAAPGYDAASNAYTAWERQDYSESARFGKIATDQAPDNAAYRILYINSLTQLDQYRAAHTQFPELASRPVPDPHLLDAAYTAQRLGEKKQSIKWFSQAIETADAGRMHLDPVTRENVRQTVSDLDRQWGLSTGISYGSVGVMNPAFAPSLSHRKTLQSAAELYWRSPWAGDGGGKHLEVYIRGNLTHYDGTEGATGISTLQSAIGVRLKPLSTHNVVIAAEHLFKVGRDSRDDWLLRAAWSDGEGAQLPAGKNSGRYWQTYAEVDYFVKHPQVLATMEARYGRNFRMTTVSPNLSMAPHLVITAGYDSLLARRSTLGAGAGVHIRYRFREDAHHAPQSYIDLTVQYRIRIAGDDRSKGVFASLYFAY